MTESSTNTLFGQSPKRYGLASVIASGLLGIGTGIYYNEWLGVVTGALGVGLAGFGVWSVWWGLSNF